MFEALGLLAIVPGLPTSQSAHLGKGWLPLHGRWLRYLGLVLSVALIIGLLWPLTRQDAVYLAFAAAYTLLGVFVMVRLLSGVDAPRSKSIDVGTGILILPETGGPLPEDLRDELALWQRAGREGLSRVPWDGGLP